MAVWRRRSNARNIETRLAALQSDLHVLQEDMKGLANGVSDAASDVLRSTNKAAEHALESVGEWTNDGVGSLRHTVREQPLAAVILSIGAGALLGALLLRR